MSGQIQFKNSHHVRVAIFFLLLNSTLWGATLGKVVPLGGLAADIALDEGRRVLYAANYTANRIDVVSLSDFSVRTSMNVAQQPSSLSLSPDGRYLVVTHFSPQSAPITSNNALTVIDLNTNNRQTFTLSSAPLGVQFGLDGKALLVTTTDFLIFDAASGTMQTVAQLSGVVAKALPAAAGDSPAKIVASSLAANGDLSLIYGVLASGSNDTTVIHFRYDVNTKALIYSGIKPTPALGPRALSVSKDGRTFIDGWLHFETDLYVRSKMPTTGVLNVGTHAIDSSRGLIYSQVPSQAAAGAATGSTVVAAEPPVLQILDSDNLTVLSKILLPENAAGKSILSSDSNWMYSISESGILAIPVGTLSQSPRVVANVEDLVFRTSFCDRQALSQQITIVDPGGNRVPFGISSSNSGVTISPATGVTPATVTVRIDPEAFRAKNGTSTITLALTAPDAVNIPPTVRVLVNSKEPDQRGTTVNVPGNLVDLLADPARDRFYILRKDTNQILVFDGTTNSQIATIKSPTEPLQMAFSFDRKYLMVANDRTYGLRVYDLDTLQEVAPVRFPIAVAPRSIACSSRICLAAVRDESSVPKVASFDLATRRVSILNSLGVYKNEILEGTTLVASSNGANIMLIQSDGTAMLYNAVADAFTISRKLTGQATGAYAASNFDQFVVGNQLLNASLVPIRTMDSSAGLSSGFAFVDQSAIRVGATNSSSPGVIQRVNLPAGETVRGTRLIEAPIVIESATAATGAAGGTTSSGGITASTLNAFSRTLAPLANRNSIIVMTTSGFTVLPWVYDAATAAPRLERVINAADQAAALAPGSLISITGRDLSPVNLVSSALPLPTALGESCLTINGLPVPVLYVSPTLINAQLPYQVDGNVTMVLRTPGGVSDNYNLTMLPAAPSIFRNSLAGSDTPIPAVIRAANNELVTVSNPVHRDDTLTIYLSGMGNTSPAVPAGTPSPADPLPSVSIAPTVTLGGVQLPVSFAGLTPGEIGVYQVNVSVNRRVNPGLQVPLVITQSGNSSSVNLRVVD